MAGQIKALRLMLFRRAHGDNQYWLRMALAAAVLLLSFFLATRAAKLGNPMLMVLDPIVLGVVGLAGVLVILRFPYLGFLALAAGSSVVPFSVGTGTATAINFTAIMIVGLTGLWIFDMIARDRQITLVSSITNAPLLVFVVIVLLAFLVGQLPWFIFASSASITAQIGGTAIFILSAAAFLVTANRVRDEWLLKWMVWLFLGVSALYVIGQIIPPLSSISARVFQRGTFNSSMFWVWITAMAFSQAGFNAKLALRWRVALMVLVAGVFYFTLGKNEGWTSGWLPSAAVVGVILVVSRSRWAWASIVLAIGALALKADSIQRLLYAGDNEYSLMTRIEAWKIVGEIIQVNPLLGLGPSNYYWYTPLYNILGYTIHFNSHNQYVDLVAQVGLLGLAAFLWFAIAVGILGLQLVRLAPPGFPRAFAIGAVGGWAGTLIAGGLGDWFLPFVYNVGLSGMRSSVYAWMFTGGMVALAEMIRQGKIEPSPEAQVELAEANSSGEGTA
jgi:O-antigen ligase